MRRSKLNGKEAVDGKYEVRGPEPGKLIQSKDTSEQVQEASAS